MTTPSFYNSSSSTTYYEILQLSPAASPLEIKKAYRRLALQYHPDRNSDPNAKELFQQVGQAYACLSDPIQRREYDRELQQQQCHVPADSTYTPSPSSAPRCKNYYHPRGPNPVVIDPWTQFDFLFHNDPFFRDYFENPAKVQQEWDDLQHAASTIPSTTRGNSSSSNNNRRGSSDISGNPSSSSSSSRVQQEGWIPWLLRQCGIQFTMTTIVQDENGRIHAKQISSVPSRTLPPQPYKQQQQQPSPRHSASLSSAAGAGPKATTTIQQETVSYIENGQRVWIKKRQVQGTLVEDKIVESTLVERKINGVSVPLRNLQPKEQQ